MAKRAKSKSRSFYIEALKRRGAKGRLGPILAADEAFKLLNEQSDNRQQAPTQPFMAGPDPSQSYYANMRALGETPLYAAARLGNLSTVVELLRLGASATLVNDSSEPPLWIAARRGHLEVLAHRRKAAALGRQRLRLAGAAL